MAYKARVGTLCHITVGGTPLCQHPAMMRGGRTCEYRSLAAAERVKRELQRVVYPVRVVRGLCPVG